MYNTATLTNTTVSGNNACSGNACTGNTYGGGIYIAPPSASGSQASMTLTTSTVKQNTACNGICSGNYHYGGGIDNAGIITVENSSATLNAACSTDCTDGYGGGIYSNGTTTLSNSTLGGSSTGGDENRGCSDCKAGYGGGIYVANGTTSLLNSTVSGNTGCSADGCLGAGGGLFNAATAYLTNTTMAQNRACTGTRCNGGGGAIVNNSVVYLTNSTVSGNTACSDNSCTARVGGIDNLGTMATLSNTILAGNTDPSGTNPDCGGSALSNGSYPNIGTVGDNIIGNDTGCSFSSGPGDLVGTGNSPIDPKLDPLGSYGGPTQTMRLSSTSPAIGAGNADLCRYTSSPFAVNNLDQRGFPRHADTRLTCDVGAYDTHGVSPIIKGWNLLTVTMHLAGSAGSNLASRIVNSLDRQLGSSTAIIALVTYIHGTFHLYIPGYSPDQSIGFAQGFFVLSNRAGEWLPDGSAYTDSQTVHLQPGWNLVGVPYVSGSSSPYAGLNGDDINAALERTCGLQEVAIDVNGRYQVYTPSRGPVGYGFHVPITFGMWIKCTTAYDWTP
jgi:hypothetical protein